LVEDYVGLVVTFVFLFGLWEFGIYVCCSLLLS